VGGGRDRARVGEGATQELRNRPGLADVRIVVGWKGTENE